MLVDPYRNFGRPAFASNATPVGPVLDRIDAGEQVREVRGHVGEHAVDGTKAGPLGQVAAQRWKAQVNENAKSPAFAGVYPELCHNEVVGWGQHGDVTRPGLRLQPARELVGPAVLPVGARAASVGDRVTQRDDRGAPPPRRRPARRPRPRGSRALDACRARRVQLRDAGLPALPRRRGEPRRAPRRALLRPLGDVVVLMPPLTVTEGELERIVDTLAAAITEVAA